jgi:thiamine biosynthesis lipoprotein
MKTSIENQTTDCATLQRFSLSGETMGTRYTALFFADSQRDEATIANSLFAAVDQVDKQMSSWKDDSDLSRLNAWPVGQWLDVQAEFVTVLTTALDISRQSDGAFDIGVGDLVRAWGFGPGLGQADAEEIAALAVHTRPSTSASLEIDQHHKRVRKLDAIHLDLAGIAKGFGVDQLARSLEQQGISNYLVGIDGEMRASGLKPDGKAWAVAIEKPIRGVREVMGVMELSDIAIATSGDYRHWVNLAGQDYSHTMHPSMGRPLQGNLTAVTVLDSSCMIADAWATILLVLGEQAGPELAKQRGMDALFIVRDGAGFREISVVGGQLQA